MISKRTSLLVCIVVVINYVSFADAGLAYRFHLDLISKKGDTISGYFYHQTYDTFDIYTHNGLNFKSFVAKDQILVYDFVTTFRVGIHNIDFSSTKNKHNIKFSELEKVKINEVTNVEEGTRLIELTDKEWSLLKLKKPKFEYIYNETFAENCRYILITWESDSDLKFLKKHILKKIDWLLIDLFKRQNEFYQFMDNQKKEFLNKDILIINHCEVL